MEGINVVFITENNSTLSPSVALYLVASLSFSLKDDISAVVGIRCKVTDVRQMTNDLKMATSSVPLSLAAEEMNVHIIFFGGGEGLFTPPLQLL